MQWPVLGLTRFFLAVVVASSHLAWYTFPEDPSRVIGTLSGLVAVLGFLVISGFSIAASYARDESEFYYRRMLRILPQYVLLTAGSAALRIMLWRSHFASLQVPHEPTYPQLFLNLCFAQGFIADSIVTNPMVWSLSLEVFFYACTPLLARCSSRVLLGMGCVGAVSYVFTARFYTFHYPDLLWGLNVVLLGWTWILGFWAYRAKGRAIEVAWVIGLVALTLNHEGMENLWMVTWTIPLLAIKFGPRLRWRERPASLFLLLGDISYPLYLVHYPLYLAMIGFQLAGNGTQLLIWALAAATLLDRLYDRPVKRLINRLRVRLQSDGPVRQRNFLPADMASQLSAGKD